MMFTIKHVKQIFLSLFALVVCGNLYAQHPEQHHPANFSLNLPFNVVAAETDPQSEALAKRIAGFVRRQNLNTPTTSNITSRRNIIITQKEKVGQFPKNTDAYSLKVTKENIFIEHTSSTALFWAYDALVSRFKVQENFLQKLFKKSKSYIEACDIVSNEGEESRTDLVRLVSRPMPVDKIKERIEKSLGSNITTLFVELLSTGGCVLQCRTMELFNPNGSYVAPVAITVEQLEELNQYAQTLGVTLVPMVELSEPENKPLSDFTGHPVHSVEGLRFSKALLKELCDGTTVSTICIGKKQSDSLVQTKYITPMVELLHKSGKRAVVQ